MINIQFNRYIPDLLPDIRCYYYAEPIQMAH